MSDEGWRDADPAAVAESVCYALRFDLSGKAHGKRAREDDTRIARHIVAHLLRSNHRILQGPLRSPHSTSDFGRNPGGLSGADQH